MMIDNPLVIIIFIIGFYKGVKSMGKLLKRRGVGNNEK